MIYSTRHGGVQSVDVRARDRAAGSIVSSPFPPYSFMPRPIGVRLRASRRLELGGDPSNIASPNNCFQICPRLVTVIELTPLALAEAPRLHNRLLVIARVCP